MIQGETLLQCAHPCCINNRVIQWEMINITLGCLTYDVVSDRVSVLPPPFWNPPCEALLTMASAGDRIETAHAVYLYHQHQRETWPGR